jgi:nitrogen fixation NifU-like protein
MSDLRELYQEVILDHSKHPRNFGPLADADRSAEGYNPLCGDHIKIYLKMNGERVEDIRFEGKGCAICTASSSLMTETIKGMTEEEASPLYHRFHSLITAEDGLTREGPDLGKLAVFAGVREFPLRVKCATLPWHTLRAALEDVDEPVSTE